MKLCSLLLVLALVLHPSIAGAWGNVFNGTPIGTGTNNQVNAVAVPDGAGGAIIAWADNRVNTYDIYAQRVNAWGQALWTANGVPVRVATSQQTNPTIASDGAGGAIIFYEHLANNGSTNIEAQHIDATGAQLWLNPTLICSAQNDQSSPRAVSDGAGGAIAVWQDDRPGSTAVADVFAQRVNGSGVVQWTNEGVAVCTAANKQVNARITGDGSGGAIFAWTDMRDNSTYAVYAQRINSAGTLQWTADGVLAGSDIGAENTAALASDNAGGAIVAWHSDTDGDNDIYAQRINNGVIQWNIGGVSVCAAIERQSYPQITADGSGGAIVAWEDLRSTVSFIDEDIYAQRINSSGASLWTPNGNLVCAETAQSLQPQIISDGASGAVIVWTDTRFMDYNLYAQRVNAAGTRLWASAGAILILAASGQTGPSPVTDGAGGVIAAWNDTRSGNFDVYANRITGGGITPTAVGDTPAVARASLGQNRPNPFNPSTTIEYTLTARTPVKIEIFDATGARVASLDEGMREPGTHRAQWNASPTVSSGVYFYRLAGAPASESRKMVLIK